MAPVTATATIAGTTIASTTRGVRLEGNIYFPLEDVETRYLSPAAMTTLCPWKGVARYRNLTVAGVTVPDAAWTYPLPTPFAWFIRKKIAFSPDAGVDVSVSSR